MKDILQNVNWTDYYSVSLNEFNVQMQDANLTIVLDMTQWTGNAEVVISADARYCMRIGGDKECLIPHTHINIKQEQARVYGWM